MLSQEEIKRVFTKKTPLIQKSLSIILRSLQGYHVVIELKNNIEISGYLEGELLDSLRTLLTYF